MKIRRAQLSDLWRQATLPEPPQGESSCLSAETLERAALGDLGHDESPVVVDHLTQCSRCSAILRELRALDEWAEEAETAINGNRSPGLASFATRPAARILGLAAIAVLAVGLGALWHNSDRSSRTVSRGMSANPAPFNPADGAVLTSAPVRLTWSPRSSDARYLISLYDSESTLLWRSQSTSESFVELPDHVCLELHAPGRYYWRVTDHVGLVEHNRPLLTFHLKSPSSTP